MSHTKEKWEISSYRHGEIWAGANYHIATCHRGSISDEECQANARLIAAAPETAQQRDDLLAALKHIYKFTKYAAAVKKVNTDEFLEEFFVLGEAAQKIAKAAIAKCQPSSEVIL